MDMVAWVVVNVRTKRITIASGARPHHALWPSEAEAIAHRETMERLNPRFVYDVRRVRVTFEEHHAR